MNWMNSLKCHLLHSGDSAGAVLVEVTMTVTIVTGAYAIE